MTSSIFEVLAEPNRRRILDLLREREHSVGELVKETQLSQPGVSKHLRILREAGLVEVRQKAQKRVYHLHAEPLVEIDKWLEPYRRFWSDKLDALEKLLNEENEEEIRPLPQQRPLKKKGDFE
ncbi:DNA-binding transcriptional ArsR family regulator [Melghirimyces profundicolus]|uniref:DNA-binding transcriptional ArsR family regulator n=1 Tax=Melghirimyces profundicolus TaxID=1242148 RepID=A0A2T6BC72_9BACL|nr:metalloregulator ArsR/SmtB family transcription factor [Melghirimyces profundicolus]PTX53644.1 DNA-binding transcriptional ArsR family regulator [Melghirimyces profundicolus]